MYDRGKKINRFNFKIEKIENFSIVTTSCDLREIKDIKN